jgi:hypothetical protein
MKDEERRKMEERAGKEKNNTREWKKDERG